MNYNIISNLFILGYLRTFLHVKYGDRATQELDSGVLISTYHARPVGAYGASVALSSSLVDPNSLLLLLLLSQHLCCYELLH